MLRILVVEDEESIRLPIELNLEAEGYAVTSCVDGKSALAKIEAKVFDLVILDLMLPKMSGEEVMQHLNKNNFETPVIIISAKNSPDQRILGLKHGAVDYITKPFGIEELLLRVKNVLARTLKSQPKHFQIGTAVIDFDAFSAEKAGTKISLSSKEVQLLQLFIANPNIVLSRQVILQKVWGYEVFPTTRTIDNFINNFRKYFEEDPKNPNLFISIRGVGYMFSHNSFSQ